jgi:hypothetical protein
MRTKIHLLFLSAVATLALLSSACSSSVQTASALETSAAPPARAPQVQPSAEAAVAESSPKSVFTVDQSSRDPFFPNARPVEEEVSSTPELAIDVPTVLRANLHGIISAGGKSIAYIGNVMLEEGRNAVIPIRAGGQERLITVRCREVTKDTVVLEVQGYTEPVRLTRAGR